MPATPEQMDEIIGRIEEGESQTEIARSIGVSIGTLSNWLNSPEYAERSARARELSAESWLDRGMQALMEAPPDQAEIARARALEQHFARRAAIRNPKYRDKVDLDAKHSGSIAVSLASELAALNAKTQ